MLTTLRITAAPCFSTSSFDFTRMNSDAAFRMRHGAFRCTSIMASNWSSLIFWITASQV